MIQKTKGNLLLVHLQCNISRNIGVTSRANQVLYHKTLHFVYCSLALILFTVHKIYDYMTTIQPLVILFEESCKDDPWGGYKETFSLSNYSNLKTWLSLNQLYIEKEKALPKNVQTL